MRIHQADGSVRAATSMTAEQVQQAVVHGATALVLQLAEREVPKPEKQKLLQPQHVPLEVGAGKHFASAVHASAECSFVTFEDGAVRPCPRTRRAKGFLDRWWTAQHRSANTAAPHEHSQPLT